MKDTVVCGQPAEGFRCLHVVLALIEVSTRALLTIDEGLRMLAMDAVVDASQV